MGGVGLMIFYRVSGLEDLGLLVSCMRVFCLSFFF
jgi:hypothetical protein